MQADYLLHADMPAQAAPHLEAAAKATSGTQGKRLWFLLGQVYARLGDKERAYQAFRNAGKGASTPYRAKLNARIKQSEVFTGGDIRKEVNTLRSMARFERNSEFLDQIYYAIGNLYLSRRDTAQAKENYIKAIEKSTRGGIDKALAQLALGDIYFTERDYVKAQPCYSEAVPLLSEGFPDYDVLRRRSDVLDELSLYSGNVQLQDSLLTLSKMTPEEQREVCQKIVDDLLKKEKEAKEAAEKEEYLANQQGQASPMDKNKPATPSISMNTDKSWYFYN
ncbi:MAG: tetratricopeptide repeat protein, partial [Muribaculaceae bacterium]|nr:tetratricopeptide repeat protein [Muribaculaceae bacterium]